MPRWMGQVRLYAAVFILSRRDRKSVGIRTFIGGREQDTFPFLFRRAIARFSVARREVKQSAAHDG